MDGMTKRVNTVPHSHASYEDQADRVSGRGAGAGDQGQGKVAGNGGAAGHEDRSQPGQGRLANRFPLA